VLALLAGACAEDRSFEIPAIASKGVYSVSWPDPAPQRLDLLFVIDSSPAMAAFQDRLREGMWGVADAIPEVLGRLDIHVGVITADLGNGATEDRVAMPGACRGWGDAGALRRSVVVDGAFITDHRMPDRELVNTRGSFTDALRNISDVGAGGCARTQPLEALRIALDHDPHNAGFLRDDAKLAIVIITARDDESPGDVATYRDFLSRLKPDPDDVMVALAVTDGTSCGTNGTERLRALGGPTRLVTSLCSDDLPAFLFQASCVLGEARNYTTPCIDAPLLDLDPVTPGIQPACSITDDEQSFPGCADGAAPPCWRVATDEQLCTGAQHLRFFLDRGERDPRDANNVVVAQCVSR